MKKQSGQKKKHAPKRHYDNATKGGNKKRRAPQKHDDNSISLNKFISNKGLCSRREADQWIDEGRLTINGKQASKGNRVYPSDKVTLDGKILKRQVKPIYIMLNKPKGITCTTDRKDKTNIIDFLNSRHRIFPIGRLDKESTGLILLTNDGDIVNEILRKENKNEKEYIVTVNKDINQEFIEKMSKPMYILGNKTLPCKVVHLKNKVFRITLTQGLNRQIRRMCEKCGYKVLALKRVRIMHLRLGHLQPGAWRNLTEEELEKLGR